MRHKDIEYPASYEAAIRDRIRANARKGRRARWFAEDPSRCALIDQLHIRRHQ